MLTQLQTLENELSEVRRAKDSKNALLDDSHYSRVQRDIDAVKKRLAIEKEKVELFKTSGKGPVEEAEEARAREQDREKKIEAKFGGGAKAVTTPAKN
jgi:predicted  nucleic acid-binding Zn-ribbon protein